MILLKELLNAILELYPIFSRMRMLRQWGGIVDICPDASPIISKTSIKGFILIVVGELVDLKQLQVLEIYLHIQLQTMNLINLMQHLILIDL